jgi:outer membrane lipoprotein carrier protein
MAYAATIGAMTLAPVVSTQLSAAPTAASAQQATSSLVKQLSGLQRLTADFEQTTKVTNSKPSKKKA